MKNKHKILFLLIIIGFFYTIWTYLNYESEKYNAEEISLNEYSDVEYYCRMHSPLLDKECSVILKDKKVTNKEFALIKTSFYNKISDEINQRGLSYKNTL